MGNYLFVYGTLRRGGKAHEVLLSAGATFICMARTINKYELTTINGFPAAIPSSQGKQIVGELYEVQNLAPIDEYEDAPTTYIRVLTDVECLDTKSRYRAWIYILRTV